MLKKIIIFLAVSLPLFAAENDSPVPIFSLSPLAETGRTATGGAWDLGLVATNALYALPNSEVSLYTGYFRPWFWFSPLENTRVDMRGRFTAQEVIEQPSGGSITSEYYGSLEVFSVSHAFSSAAVIYGRQFFFLGQGLLFSNFADGAAYKQLFGPLSVSASAFHSGDYGTSLCEINVEGCGSYQVYRLTPGLSADEQPASAGSRLFGSAEISAMLSESRIYAIGLYSRDLVEEKDYAYHPWYAALGAEGIFLERFNYLAEFLYQGGTTHNKDAKEASIGAYAILSELAWSMPVLEEALHPDLIVGYAYGSGDSDISTTAFPVKTNIKGSQNAFSYFGSYSLGLAYSAVLANMQAASAGFLVRPLDRMAMELRGFYYAKTGEGVVLDSAATGDGALGYALDATLSWRVFPDLYLYYGFGFFTPGEAYPSGTETTMAHLVSLSFSF